MSVGIICEYNPFHNGHAYQIARAKQLGGGEPVVCVMSGSFVQRGDLAVLPKHIRAKAALMCGADLVVELPLTWALSSAEGFAKGGVGLLGALGVDKLSFGSECGDGDALQALAAVLASEEMEDEIKKALAAGCAYGQARQSAAEKLAGDGAQLLKNPNDLLGAEYLAAAKGLGVEIIPLPVKRVGAGHDDAAVSQNSASATALRDMIARGRDVSPFVPESAAALYREAFAAGCGPVTMEGAETAILSRLRRMDETAWDTIPGGGEGLGRRLMNAAASAATFDELCEKAKTKRYPMARIRRAVLWAALGLKDGDADGLPPYIRVLGANAVGRTLLRSVSDDRPVVIKPASMRGFGGEAERVFTLEAAATDLYTLALPNKELRRGGQEWTTSPVML